MWWSLLIAACTPTLPVEGTVPETPGVPIETAWLAEASATGLAARMRSGELTSAALVEASIRRIDATNAVGPALHAVIAVHPNAVSAARALDEEEGDGLLRGLPVLIKDNVDVAGIHTTAGSLALAGHVPADDAFLVARLRDAGAVILGKANLSEWANFRSTRSSSGWSAVGGQARNPHALDRSPCGSSSGSAVAVAAGLAPLAIGTETDGSILCPASINGIVGVKPTLGLVSRDGIVPIAHSQDTAGPMARTVADAALLLEALAAADPDDPPTSERPDALSTDYTTGLADDALSGAKIGVARGLYDFEPGTTALFEAAVADLVRLGATVVEVTKEVPEAAEDQEWEVLLHEFRPDLEAYLADVDGVDTLDDLVAFNRDHAETELRWFGQEIFEMAAEHPRDDDYAQSRDAAKQALGPDWIDALVAEHGLDAIVAPTTGPAWPIDLVLGDRYTGGSSSITAVTGYPAVTVPMGRVEGLPVGLTLMGPRWSEGRLLALAHAYEQGTGHRVVPGFAPTVGAP